ncbi:uncharacterized protein OCT59_000630 [Rhizophagus irregularis]|nr:hypothetical protein OCT59_000630 [Rhizophagus irregularis]
MSTIFKEINNLPFDDNEKADLLDFFTNRDTTKVEAVLPTIEKDEVKVNYLRKHAKSLRAIDNLISSEEIEEIIKPYARDPLPHEPSDDIPNDVSDISTHLKFVNREKEIIKLMKNMDNLYRLVINPKAFSQPKKEIRFPTAVGTAGKGKTTFARVAFENQKVYSTEINSEVVKAVKEARHAGQIFQIMCDDLTDEDFEYPETSFAIRLLHEALKVLKNIDITLTKFRQILGIKTIELDRVIDIILGYFPNNEKGNKRLFIINIDETNILFNEGRPEWLKTVLKALARVISNGYFLFVILTGTHANALFNLIESTNAKIEDINLPLLKVEHAKEVILELANRGVTDETKRINKISIHLEYIIELLGVVGRFLEVMIFQMGIIGKAVEHKELTYGEKFYQSGLRYFLQKCQYKPEYCQKLLEALKKKIGTKYSRYFEVFMAKDNLELVPILTAYTIFEWPVDRSTTFGSKKRKVEDLEKDELVFLEGNRKKKLKIPFLTLHEIFSSRNTSVIPPIKVLDTLSNALSPDQNEHLTISVIMFRLWAIYQRLIEKGSIGLCTCKLSQLIPLRENQNDELLEFEPVFSVQSTNKKIEQKNWREFIKHRSSECIAYHNLQGAEFADSFVLTNPPILIQDKQLVVSRKKLMDGYQPIMLTKGLVKEEHDKCRNVGPHIFLFVTDAKKRLDEIYEEDELVITIENKNDLFGGLLTLRILHCIERA